jgi:hypothetical protein
MNPVDAAIRAIGPPCLSAAFPQFRRDVPGVLRRELPATPQPHGAQGRATIAQRPGGSPGGAQAGAWAVPPSILRTAPVVNDEASLAR